MLGLYVDADEALVDGWLCQQKKPVWSGGERLSIERARISEETSHISVESRYNYRTLAQLLAWLSVIFSARVYDWIETDFERISRVDLGSALCAATWFSSTVTAWIIDEVFRRRTFTYKPSNSKRYRNRYVYTRSYHRIVLKSKQLHISAYSMYKVVYFFYKSYNPGF